MKSPEQRARLVHHVQELERLAEAKQHAADALVLAFGRAGAEGYDSKTLKVVLKLRKMTPGQRRERRALEAIYMAALGMLDGDALPESARRRFDEDHHDEPEPKETQDTTDAEEKSAPAPPAIPPPPPAIPPPPPAIPPPPPEQPSLILKDPEEARQEGTAAAADGKRIYDNPYAAGDPCRAAWDEGWCAQQQSHGMETPAAFQRRSPKPPPPPKRDDRGAGAGDAAPEAP